MHPLVGYCDRWSVKPGERIRFMVSSAQGARFIAFLSGVLSDIRRLVL